VRVLGGFRAGPAAAAAEAGPAVRAVAGMIEKMMTERTGVPAPVPPASEAVELADLPILTAAAPPLAG